MQNICTLLICVLTAATLSAQLGVKGGVNVSTLRLEDEESLRIDNKQGETGWQAGFFYRLQLSDALSIQPELLYVERGSEFEILNAALSRADASVESETKYVEIPVVARLRLGALPVNIQVGAYGAYLADVEYTFRSGLLDMGSDLIDDDRDNYNRSDWGFIGGVGVEFLNFTIDLRYTQGWQAMEGAFMFRNVAYLETAKNDALMLNVGYRFW